MKERQIMSEGWGRYRTKAFSSDLPVEYLVQLRRAYYAGAMHLMDTVLGAVSDSPEPEERELSMMDALHKELGDFGREVLSGRK